MENSTTTNHILLYWDKIQSGEILVNFKIKRTYQKIVEDLRKSELNQGEWEYSQGHANHVIDFIEKYCKHSKGKWAGKPVVLDLWQKAAISTLYGFLHYDTRERKYTELFMAIPRKNGKSLLASCLGVYHFVFDGEMGASVITAASKKDQAKIVFDESRLMIKKSPALAKRILVRRSDLWHEDSESTFKPVSSDSNSLDGENGSCIILDEAHAIPDMNLYDVLKDSQSARFSPMFLTITTMGTVRNGIFDNLYDLAERIIKGYDDENYVNERMLCLIYELDNPKVNVHKPDMWNMCNPMMGVTKAKDKLIEKYERAKQNLSLLPNFLCKEMNVRSSSSVAWLQFEQYNNEEVFSLSDLPFRYFIGGADLSKSHDWTSACALMKLPNDEIFYMKNMYWITRSMMDNNPHNLPLETWYEMGYFRICEGEQIDHTAIVEWFLELQHEHDVWLWKCGYDNWSSSLFVDTMNKTFGEKNISAVIQGKKTLSAPMHYLGKLFEGKKINYDNNPITKMHIGNTMVDTDKNGNIQPIKGSNNAKKIDGLACMLNSVVVYLDVTEEYESSI